MYTNGKNSAEARKEYLKLPSTMANSFQSKFGEKTVMFTLSQRLKIFCEYCGCCTEFGTTDMIRKVANSQLPEQTDNHFADKFLQKYEKDIDDLTITQIFQVFYVYKECNEQFSVEDYIKKIKKGKK